MADFSEWGAQQSGSRTYVNDMAALAGQSVQMQEGLGRIAAQPAHARLVNAQAGEAELKLKQDQMFMQAWQKRQAEQQTQQATAAKSAEDQMLEMLNNAAADRASAGQVDAAGKLANVASQITNRRVTAQAAQDRGEWYHAKTINDQFQAAASTLSPVVDQASYDLAKLAGPARGLDFSKLPPRYEDAKPLINQLTESALTVKQQFDELTKETEAKSRDELRQARIGDIARRAPLIAAQTKLALAREANVGKTGGSTKLSKIETDQALRIIETGVPGMKDDDPIGLQNAAYAIAEEAKTLMRRNPAVDSLNQAMNLVFQQHKEAGEFQVGEKGILGVGKKPAKFVPGAGSAQNPLAIPKTAAKLKSGKVYNTARGPAKWDGKQFMPVKASSRPAGSVAAPEEDDEEDDN